MFGKLVNKLFDKSKTIELYHIKEICISKQKYIIM